MGQSCQRPAPQRVCPFLTSHISPVSFPSATCQVLLHLVHGFLPHSGSEGCPSSCSPPPTPQVLPQGTHHTLRHKPHQQASPSYQPGEVPGAGQVLPGFAKNMESQHPSLSQPRRVDVTATERGRWKMNVTLTIARAAAQSLQNTKCLSSWLPSEGFRKAGKRGGIFQRARAVQALVPVQVFCRQMFIERHWMKNSHGADLS